MRRRARIAALMALVACLAAPAAALAAGDLEVGIEDERIMLDDFHRSAPAAVAAWSEIGVDVVRLHARWNRLAPGPHARRRPAGFNAANPYDRHYNWSELDRAVNLLRAYGLKVALTVTGPGPLWSSRAPKRGDGTYKPDARAYGQFARAVALRYRGQIERYMVWNEPNIAGWLSPQSDCRRVGRGGSRRTVCTPVSPHIYRALVRSGVAAIHAADPGPEVLMGELAPIGNEPRSNLTTIAPLPFFRAMGCVDNRFRKLRTGLCRGFKPAAADAIGHHPHGVFQAPDEPSKDKQWAKMGDLSRLFKTLDRLTRAKRLRAPNGRFDMHLTEFGYQTSPPDHVIGIRVSRQAAWLQQASYLSWRNPRVRSIFHYQWEDEPVRYRGTGSLAYAGWQSGLLYVNGRAKPALQGFATPLVVDRPPGTSKARVWGQVREGGAHVVTLQRRQSGGFVTVATFPTDQNGYWSRSMNVVPGDALRYTWTDPESPYAIRISGTAVVQGGRGARLTSAG
jgi:hypothetical protein